MAEFVFAGETFRIIDRTALYWPAQDALLVADLHLEKGSWFAERGQMLPPYDSIATLDRLAAILARCGASQVWALGDNFHDSEGPGRMADTSVAKLAALTQAHDWHWITGNHDEHLPEGIGGTLHDEARLNGLILRHRAEPMSREPELSGHWHPKHAMSARGRRITRPCFVMSPTRLILPAFGAYTGGMTAHDPAIMAVTGPAASALLESGGRVVRFALTQSE